MKRLFVLLGLLLILLPAWGISVPTGATKDFTSGVSFRGMSVEWRNFYMRDAAYGINVGWNVFNETDDSTVFFDNAAITGKRWHYINAIPIYGAWYKYFSDDKRSSRFYAGINAGTAWIEQRTEMSLYQLTEDNWHFAVAPEVGMNLPWDSFLGYVAARYHYAFKTGDMEAQQWIEFKIGFGLD